MAAGGGGLRARVFTYMCVCARPSARHNEQLTLVRFRYSGWTERSESGGLPLHPEPPRQNERRTIKLSNGISAAVFQVIDRDRVLCLDWGTDGDGAGVCVCVEGWVMLCSSFR